MPEPTQEVEPPAERAPTSPAPAPYSRRALIGAIFACAVVVGVFATLAVWINRQVLNTNSWTNTSSQLLADPKIETAVGGVLVNELFSSVNVSAEIKSALPSQLAGLAAPATAGLRALAIQVAPQVLSTATVQSAWRVANRTAQLELLRILNGGSKTVSTTNGVVVLHLYPLLMQLAAQLGLQEQLATVQSGAQGAAGAAARGAVQQKLGVTLPPLSANIVILRSSQLKTAQNLVKSIKGFALVLPVIAFGLFILAVWLAEGWRRVAVRATGWCLIGIGVIVVLARRIIGDVLVDSLVKGALKQAGCAPGLRDWHKPSLRHRDRTDHLRSGDRDRRLDPRSYPARARTAPHAGALTARARTVRLRGRRAGAAARGRLGAVPLDASADPGHRHRRPARAGHPGSAPKDGAGVPRCARRRYRALDPHLVLGAPTFGVLGDLGSTPEPWQMTADETRA